MILDSEHDFVQELVLQRFDLHLTRLQGHRGLVTLLEQLPVSDQIANANK